LQIAENVRAGAKRVFAKMQNAVPIFRSEHCEKADAYAKRIFGTRVLFRESTNAIEKRLAAERRDGVLLTLLTALAWNSLFRHPLVRHKATQLRIDEVVVQLSLAEDQSGILLESVAVLRAFEKHAKDY